MAALLYFTTAAVLAWLTSRLVRRLSLAAAIVLVLLPVVLTGRALLTGRIYAPVEMPYIAQPLADHRPMMHIPPVANGVLSDIAFQMIPWREAVRRSVAAGEWPLLNRHELSGDILAASSQPAVWSPFTWIALLMPAAASFTFTASIVLFMAALGGFLLMRELGASEEASLVGAVAWTFCAPIALQLLWPLGFAWALVPLLLAATRRVIVQPDARSIAFLTVALVLETLAGHPETLLHAVFVAGLFGIFEWFQAGRPSRAIGAVAIAGVLTLLITAIELVPFVDAVRQTAEYRIRNELFAKKAIYTPPQFVRASLLGDVFPFTRASFGALPLSRAEAGSIVLTLACFAVAFVRSRRTWFFAALLLFFLLAGAQAWPVAGLLHRLPLFNVTLNERLAAVVPLCLAVLAAIAVDRLRHRDETGGADATDGEPRPEGRRAVLTGLAIAVLTVVAIAAWHFRSPDRARAVAETLPLALAAVLFALRLPRRAFFAILVGLIITQRVVSDGRLVPVNEPRISYPRTALFKSIPPAGEPFRVVGRGSALIPNTATMYGLEDVRGLTPMTLGRMADTFPLWLRWKPTEFGEVRDLSKPILSMMNVRYAFLDVSDPIPPGWHDVTFEIYTRVIENERVLPRAFVPRHVRIGVDEKKTIEEMAAERDFAERAWLDVHDRPHERTNGPGRVVTRCHERGLTLDATMENDGFVVVSQAAWRGWRAYLDGGRIRVHRANHAFLAVWVPAGHHTVELKFLPQAFVVGRAITFGTLLLLLAGGLVRRLV